MMIRKQNSTTVPGRKKKQRFSKSAEENGYHTRKLNMDHLKFHLISESGKKMERNGINKSDGAKRR
jgi:hypothetical protein